MFVILFNITFLDQCTDLAGVHYDTILALIIKSPTVVWYVYYIVGAVTARFTEAFSTICAVHKEDCER